VEHGCPPDGRLPVRNSARISSVPCSTRLCVVTPRRIALWPRSRRRRAQGTLVTLPDVASTELGNSRDLVIWLPPSYARSERRYPVIYMHDGQNLFDPRTSYAEPWRVDKAMERAAQRSVDAIVVGIPNRGIERIDEYSPFVDPRAGGGKGDRYLDWVAGTVKPLIDERFRTRPDRAHTGMAGSSMGGLITMYAYLRDPAVFGFVAVLSPSLWFAGRSIFSTVAASPHIPGRIYLDIGGREGKVALDDARRLRDALMEKGYLPGSELRWVEDPRGHHNEVDWGRRFTEAVTFLLK
jgi:predicted alpha/beta superfamily hydrolase